eukprot:3493712-Amphidinium_carterae.1
MEIPSKRSGDAQQKHYPTYCYAPLLEPPITCLLRRQQNRFFVGIMVRLRSPELEKREGDQSTLLQSLFPPVERQGAGKVGEVSSGSWSREGGRKTSTFSLTDLDTDSCISSHTRNTCLSRRKSNVHAMVIVVRSAGLQPDYQLFFFLFEQYLLLTLPRVLVLHLVLCEQDVAGWQRDLVKACNITR